MSEPFINKLTEIVLANLRDENFNVDKLAAAAGMSHSTLYRKLKQLRNQDATQFIREVRLQKAMEILQQDEGTVAEIAYRVGFGSSTYFTKCFREYFGFPPGEVKKMETMGTGIHDDKARPAHGTARKAKLPLQKELFPVKQKRRNLIFAAIIILAACMLIAYSLYALLKPPEISIVVLPFKNLGDQQSDRYFADGITEDILNNLFRIGDIRVISRTSSEYFRESPMTSPEIARKLNVDYVLEGSVQRQNQDVRIFTQLIDARNDQHLLSEKYEGTMTNIFDFQSDIAKKVADALKKALSTDEIGHIDKIPTASTQAYDNYLKARFLLHKANDIQRFDISREGLMSSLRYYERAIAADSNFVEAWAGLANAWYNLAAWGWYQPYHEGVQKAWSYCNKALELDPGCAEAQAVKGVYHAYPEGRFEEAKKELELALELNPNFSTSHQWYAQLMMITGPIEKAREHVNITLELEPYFWVMHNLDSWICYFEERYEEGLQACFTGQDLNPYSSDNNWLFVLHYVKLGMGEEAAKVLSEVLGSNAMTASLGAEVMDAFNEGGIDGIFTWLINLNMERPLPMQGLNGNPYYIAWWHSLMGHREEAIHWFEKCLEAEKVPMHYFNLIAQNPDFDFLRDDPRFLAVIEEAGLAPYHNRKARPY